MSLQLAIVYAMNAMGIIQYKLQGEPDPVPQCLY